MGDNVLTTIRHCAKRWSATGRNPLFGKGASNPFGGDGAAGGAVVAGLLYLVNLKKAIN